MHEGQIKRADVANKTGKSSNSVRKIAKPVFASLLPSFLFLVLVVCVACDCQIFSDTHKKDEKMALMERTFIMIKPDGVQRGLIGKIIQRFEEKGFKLVAMKFMQASEELLQKHYADLSDRPFFPGLVKYMQMGPVVPMIWEGLNIVKTGRDIIGATNPMESQPGSLRGDLCVQVGRNIIHGSDSVPSAEKEMSLWFTANEIAEYSLALHSWIYEDN